MQDEMKMKIEMDKLVNDISSPTAPLNISKFNRVNQLINQNNKNAKYFA